MTITDKIAVWPRKPDEDDKYGPEYLWYYQDLSARYKAERDLALELLRQILQNDWGIDRLGSVKADVSALLAACGEGEA